MLKLFCSFVNIKKLFTILFHSILFSFLIHPTAMAQIKIEEEVVLDNSKGIESAVMYMPFYGHVSFYISRPWYGTCNWTSGFVCYEFVAGSQSYYDPFCNAQCGGSGGSWGDLQKGFQNVPKDQIISVTIRRC